MALKAEDWAPKNASIHRHRRQGISLWGQQFYGLLLKNFLLALRNWPATVIRAASPLFLLIIYGIDQAFRQQTSTATGTTIRSPDRTPTTGIPDCINDIYVALPCYDLLYSPNDNVGVNAIIGLIQANNQGRTIPSNKVLGFASITDAETWMLANPRMAQVAVHFMPSADGKQYAFGLQINGTFKTRRGIYGDNVFRSAAPLQVQVEREVMRYLSAGATGVAATAAAMPLSWDVGFKQFAHPAINPFSAVGSFAATALMIAGLFALTFEVYNIVTERKNKLRQAMASMGMMVSAYWMSWVAYEVVALTVTSLLTVLFGMLFQFDLFLKNDFGAVLLLFWCYEFALSGLILLFSTIINDASASYLLGLVYVIIGFIMQVSVVAGFPYDSTISGYLPVAYIFSFFPPPMLAKGVLDFGSATSSPERTGIRWNQIVSYCTDETYQIGCVWPLRDLYLWLMGDFFIYFLIAMFLDNVLPDEMGVRKPVYFFLTPSFWLGTSGACCGASSEAAHSEPFRASDPDVIEEERALKELHEARGPTTDATTVEVQGLVKSFPSRDCFGGRPFHAVKGNWFKMEEGKLFCLLGPNGAGKTTTINMLTGVLPVTAGDASVCGISLTAPDGMERIRAIMGVCPQFDLLWGELTGIEHLRVFGLIKGLEPRAIEAEARGLLERVKLTASAGVESRAYSGGMKRRLSVAVALIGDPKVVYLDEPTTGMDPISRRHVWDIIEAAKPGRIIVLTTHSMEEADILADQISIICRGRLQCLGTSLHLKQKFGTGYSISVAVSAQADRSAAGASRGATSPGGSVDGLPANEVAARNAVKALFWQQLGVAPFEEDFVYMQFLVPRAREADLSRFVSTLQAREAELMITDVNLSLTTLEEVFLKIATQAELDYATEEGRTETLMLENGTPIKVSVGAPLVRHPSDPGAVIAIRWEQDDEGRLLISSHTVRPMAPGEEAGGPGGAGRMA